MGGSLALIPIGKIALIEKLRWILGFWIGLGTGLLNFHLLVSSTEALAAAAEGGTLAKPKRYMLKGFLLRYLFVILALLLTYWLSVSALVTAAVGLIVVQVALVICQLFGATRAGG